MAREYIRPEISTRLYQSINARRQLLINPDAPDMVDALEAIQHGTRERRLDAAAVEAGWQRFQAGEADPVGLAAQTEAPGHYQWPVRSSIVQIVSLTPTLTGAVLERAAIQPGRPLDWPIPLNPGSVIERRNAIVTVFWTHLSDEDIRELDEHTAAA
jgi:hypothetical protein